MRNPIIVDYLEMTDRLQEQIEYLEYIGRIKSYKYLPGKLQIQIYPKNDQSAFSIGFVLGRFPEIHKVHPDVFKPPLK